MMVRVLFHSMLNNREVESIGELTRLGRGYMVLGEYALSFSEINWNPTGSNGGCKVERLI